MNGLGYHRKKKEIHVWEIKSLTMLFCSVPTEMKYVG